MTFEKEIGGDTSLVYFKAPWCGPCNQMKEYMEEFADHIVDVEEQRELVNRYSVRSVPTVMVIEDGQVKKQHSGYLSKEEVQKIA